MRLYKFDIWTERKGKQTYTQRWPPPAPNYRHRQAFHGQRRFPHLASNPTCLQPPLLWMSSC